jgi:hypothetical protein
LSTTDNAGKALRGTVVPRGPFVTREACATVHRDQREANERTWDEIRGLRRLVIGLVVGGQLFSGGVNFAGLAYWLQQHSAQPHPATVQLVTQARSEAREDVRDLRREVHELLAPTARRNEPGQAPAPTKEGASQ